MSTIPQTRRTLAALKLSRSIPALLLRARGMVTAMAGNASFPNPTPALASVNTAIANLEAAETVARTRVHGAVAVRNDQRTALVSLLDELRSFVQKVADANLENAAAIIQSAGMDVRRPSVRPKRVFEARPGDVSGTVKILAPAASKRASYEWEYSADGGKTWTELPITLGANTTLTGQTAGVTLRFRYRAATKAGVGDWSQPTSLMVR